MDVTFLINMFGDYAAILPIFILIVGALLLPAVKLATKGRTPSSVIATIVVLASMVVNILMLTGTTTGDIPFW